MWIAREIEPLVLRRASERPVVVITGARQTGKTSLVQHLFVDREFVSLDLPSEAEQAERDPRGFLSRHPPPLVIDEAQYAPGLFRHLKVAVDRDRGNNGQFVLTGSQKLTLMRGTAESLAGRADVLELEGLSLHEIRAAGLSCTADRVMLRGGFPELYQKPDLDADGFYRSYVATYLERDLRQLLDVGSLRTYERFLRACALRTSGLLNKADLSRDVGISGSTSGQWLSVLEASNQVVLLEPWFSNRGKALIKTPKLFLGDSGLAAFLMGGVSEAEIAASPLRGALWETFVFSELRRRMLARRGRWQLSLWRDRSKEVDFLFHRAGRFDLADAKWTEQPDARDASVMLRVRAELPPNSVRRMALVCRTPNPYPVTPEVEALPIDGVEAFVT
jgi:predicted AAA+ superfamily ATPase